MQWNCNTNAGICLVSFLMSFTMAIGVCIAGPVTVCFGGEWGPTPTPDHIPAVTPTPVHLEPPLLFLFPKGPIEGSFAFAILDVDEEPAAYYNLFDSENRQICRHVSVYLQYPDPAGGDAWVDQQFLGNYTITHKGEIIVWNDVPIQPVEQRFRVRGQAIASSDNGHLDSEVSYSWEYTMPPEPTATPPVTPTMIRIEVLPLISTIAGNGEMGFDPYQTNIYAVDANVTNPVGVAVDYNNIIYLSEGSTNVIRKIAYDRIYTIVKDPDAVEGNPGPGPMHLTVDLFGILYVSDQHRHRIRKITPDDAVTTIAGDNGDGDPGVEGESALETHFDHPGGLALDSVGRLYVADTGNHVIRFIQQGQIYTFAGVANNPNVLDSPIAVAVDKTDYDAVYAVENKQGGRLLKISSQGIITPTGAVFNYPVDVIVDGEGKVYVSESGEVSEFDGSRVWMVNKETAEKTLVAGTPVVEGFIGNGLPAVEVPVSGASGLAVDQNGNLLIACRDQNRIRSVNLHAVPPELTLPSQEDLRRWGGDASEPKETPTVIPTTLSEPTPSVLLEPTPTVAP